MSALREQVSGVLGSVLEDRGIGAWDGDEVEVWLSGFHMWVRVLAEPPTVVVYRGVADLPPLPDVYERLNDMNTRFAVFRIFADEDTLVLRADIPAAPLDAAHLQYALETMESELRDVDAEMAEWPS
jgi:hypothetical protein